MEMLNRTEDQSDDDVSNEIRDIIAQYTNHLNKLNWKPNQTTLYILILIYGLMIIISFLLNILIFFTVLISKSLHKPNILFSLNLIIANILASLICMPFTMNSIFEFYTFNEFLCKVIPFVQSITVFISTGTVTFIAMDRYFMITSLKRNKFKLLRPLNNLAKNKIIANFIVWLLALILSLPILIYQRLLTIRIKNIYVKQFCLEQYPEDIRIVYAVLTFLIAFIIPLMTLSYFHYKIKCYLNSNLLKFDLSKEKIITNSTAIKTIPKSTSRNLNKQESSFFINLNGKRRNSDANYYSLIDLNLFNSSESSSTTQVRDYSILNNKSDVDTRTKLSVKLINHKKKFKKSFTLNNNFQFHTYLPIYRIRLNNENNFIINNDGTIKKSNTHTNGLSTEMISNSDKTNSPSYLSLNKLSFNHLNNSTLNNSSPNESLINSSPNESLINSKLNSLKDNNNQLTCNRTEEADQKLATNNSFCANYEAINRSLSDSNLIQLSQSLHTSFLHELNQSHQINQTENHHRTKKQQGHLTPTLRSQNIDLNYLKLVNHLNQTNTRLNKSSGRRRSEQIKDAKLASFTRFSYFLNRIKRFNYLHRELQRNQKITFILFSGIIVFAISYLPLYIFNLYFDFNHTNSTLPVPNFYFIFFICHILAMSSAITNGILYGLLNTNIQKELIKLFKNCLHSKS